MYRYVYASIYTELGVSAVHVRDYLAKKAIHPIVRLREWFMLVAA